MLRDEKDLKEPRSLLSISQACFFEEIHHFHFLAETVVYDLRAGASLGRKQHVRVWSAACSRGEEPFSIAIALLEALREASDPEAANYRPRGWQVEVFASDRDSEMVTTAVEGLFRERSLNDVPLAARKRYFLRGRGDMTGWVRVKKGLADLVRFQQIDLGDTQWPVEGRFDVIFFRNALVHFEPQAQELLLRRMLLHLEPHGYLILSRSESLPGLKDAVLPLGHGIYQLRPHGTARYTGGERRTDPRGAPDPEEP